MGGLYLALVADNMHGTEGIGLAYQYWDSFLLFHVRLCILQGFFFYPLVGGEDFLCASG